MDEGENEGVAALTLLIYEVAKTTICDNCDTSIEYIQEHYFHYNAKRATEAPSTGRKGLDAAVGKDWMRDPYVGE